MAKNTATSQKQEMVNHAIEQIQKQFGKGAIMRLGEKPSIAVDSISTGILSLDAALGVGGIPRGRIVEIYGPESSGKTTVCLSVIAQAQKKGGIAAFIDVEHALDPAWAGKLGVNVDNLLISQPDTGEQALEIAESLIRSGGLDLVIIDSVAALVPQSEIEGNMGDSQMGVQARLMSQALRKLTGIVSKSKTTIIFTNQIRHKIGVFFGNPETTSGGMALKFYASIRMDIRKIETLKKGGQPFGARIRVKIVKNKIAPPFKEAKFIITGEGIDMMASLIGTAVNLGVLQRSGSFIKYKEKMIGQGLEQSKQSLINDKTLTNKIEKEVREKLFLSNDGKE